MSRRVCDPLTASPCFPRVSGDEPDLQGTGLRRSQFSPRERG